MRSAIDMGKHLCYIIGNCTAQLIGGEVMVNTKMLMERIRERGASQCALASELGIKQSTLSLKINNKRPFYLDEAIRLAELLEIHDSEFGLYFFAGEVA